MRKGIALLVVSCAVVVMAKAVSLFIPQPLTLEWNNPNAPGAVDAWRLYSSANVNAPKPWTLVTNVPGSITNVTVMITPQQMFFYVTPSNWWGEFGPSNVTNTVAGLTNGTLQLK